MSAKSSHKDMAGINLHVTKDDSVDTVQLVDDGVTPAKASFAKPSGILFTIDGGAAVITTGSKGYVTVPFKGTIKSCQVLADQSGDIEVDVKKCDYSGFPTTATIVASAPPTLSSAQKSNDATLTGWTKDVVKGDILEFVVDSVATVEWVSIFLEIEKTAL